MFFLFIFFISLFFYFLPTIVGWSKSNVGAIFVLNLLLGWSVIGWVVALVWACTNENKPITVAQNPGPSSNSTRNNYTDDRLDQIKKLKSLLDAGAITETEYNIEKSKILNS